MGALGYGAAFERRVMSEDQHEDGRQQREERDDQEPGREAACRNRPAGCCGTRWDGPKSFPSRRAGGPTSTSYLRKKLSVPLSAMRNSERQPGPCRGPPAPSDASAPTA